MRIDFSEFHDLCHWPFTRQCRSLPGGWRRHLMLAWEFRWRDRVVGFFHKPWCWAGQHRWEVWKAVRGGLEQVRDIGAPSDYRAFCRYCFSSRTATEDEWW